MVRSHISTSSVSYENKESDYETRTDDSQAANKYVHDNFSKFSDIQPRDKY